MSADGVTGRAHLTKDVGPRMGLNPALGQQRPVGEPVETPTPGYNPSDQLDYTPYRSNPLARPAGRKPAEAWKIGLAAAAGIIGGIGVGVLAAKGGARLLGQVRGLDIGANFASRAITPFAVGGAVIGAGASGIAASQLFDSEKLLEPLRVRITEAAQRPKEGKARTGTADERAYLKAHDSGKPRKNNAYRHTGDAFRLPDITPRAIKNLRISEVSGKRYLEFSATWPNVGQGPLEVLFNPRTYGDVTQRILHADGTRTEFDSKASFALDGRDSHRHTHLNDFARYSLYEANPDGTAGKLVAEHHKVSFLITDTDNVLADELDPEGYRRRVYTAPGGRVVQGMSSGWGDTYGAGLEGQEFDITNLKPGRYIIRQTFDPNDRLAEAAEGNNSYDTEVVIDGTTVGKPVSDPLGPPRLRTPAGKERTDSPQSD